MCFLKNKTRVYVGKVANHKKYANWIWDKKKRKTAAICTTYWYVFFHQDFPEKNRVEKAWKYISLGVV